MINYRSAEGEFVGKKYKKNSVFSYHISIPETEAPLGLLVTCDGPVFEEENALLQLANEGKAPYCVCIGIYPAKLPLVNGTLRNMRLDDYDLATGEYADFLVYEMIPALQKQYGLNISILPEWRMISGGSSGGICAFAAAWFHPEYFRRVYMSSPSFLAMGRGNDFPTLIRKYETKPLRIYEEYSENEPNDYFGSSYCVALEAKMSLEFANYQFNCKYFPGEGHCSRRANQEEAYKRLQWLWEDYERPFEVKNNSPRVNIVLPQDSYWEAVARFPSKEGTTASLLSSDGALQYTAAETAEELYAVTVDTGAKFLHGMLHTLPTIEPKGAIDMALDECDRLFVLTAIGIQCIRSYGLIDVILALPDNSRPLQLAFGEGEKAEWLYVRTEKGIWRRRTNTKGIASRPMPPKYISYYD